MSQTKIEIENRVRHASFADAAGSAHISISETVDDNFISSPKTTCQYKRLLNQNDKKFMKKVTGERFKINKGTLKSISFANRSQTERLPEGDHQLHRGHKNYYL